MTEVLPSLAQSHFGRSAFDQFQDYPEPHWQLPNHMPMINSHWPHTQGQQLSGIQEFDLSMLHHESQGYVQPHFGGSLPPMLSPSLAYSDMDTAGTPSTSEYPDIGDSFANVQPPLLHHLRAPQRSSASYSPRSSFGGVSPREAPLPSPLPVYSDVRPGMGPRSATAPEQGERKPTMSPPTLSGMKSLRTSDDDEEYMPGEDLKHPRGSRKRQRIPHTAVERRYRENLNAHLDKLRQAVPALAARNGPDGKRIEAGQGVKPSKCEILNGAIEHIGGLDKEILDLRSENQAMRARIEQMQSWYRANSR